MKIGNKTKLFILAGFIISLLYSCASFGGKTIYRQTNYTNKIKSIGYTNLENDTLLTKIFENTNKIYKETVKTFLIPYQIKTVEFEKNALNFSNPDTNTIIKICNNYDIDALILTKLSFINVTYSIYLIPYAKNLDTEVEMKIYDKSGKLISHTLHNTLHGNSYMFPPPTERTIKDGTEGNLKRIAKSLHW